MSDIKLHFREFANWDGCEPAVDDVRAEQDPFGDLPALRDVANILMQALPDDPEELTALTQSIGRRMDEMSKLPSLTAEDADEGMKARARKLAAAARLKTDDGSFSWFPSEFTPTERVGWMYHSLSARGFKGRGPDCNESLIGWMAREMWSLRRN